MRHALLIPIGLVLLCSLARADDCKIEFKVKVPAGTPADAKLYVVGDAKALGAWKEDGLPMTKNKEDGTYTVTATLPKDQKVEFKITRGSWKTVEKNEDGSEMANRTLMPKSDATVDVQVAAWADKPGDKPPEEKKSTRTGEGKGSAGVSPSQRP